MAMSLTEKTGFFVDYYLNLKNAQSDDLEKEIEKFGKCRDDFERMAFVEQLSAVQQHDEELQVKRAYEGKNADIAAELKEKGNETFKEKKWLQAMVLYTRSYVAVPEDRVHERAIILANRSATLYHMEKYDEALIDIKRAMNLGYPKDLIYKLYERQARCYMAKKDYPNTVACFKKCITAMDDAKMPLDRRNKMILDAMTMVKMLEKDPRTAKQAEQQKKQGTVEVSLAIPDEKEFISSAVRFDQNKEEGRFARAASDLNVGVEIIVEKPYVAVLLEKFSNTHCENCFIRTVIPIACPKCADVLYCSEKCLSHAAAKYHKYECGLLSTIRRSGASVNCHMALRVMTNRSVEYFLQMKEHLDKELSVEEIRKFPSNDYRRVAHLVRHEQLRTPWNYFQHALMARFLTKCLQAADYFGEQSKPEDIVTISGIILRNLQFIQFNTHEVAELHESKLENSKKTVFIGGALYPNLALFNHSCDPGVVRYFRGNTIHVNTIKPIEAGLQISENYGPMYTQVPRAERQAKLKELYWFDCTCDACLEDWPTYDKMPTDIIRFRCDGPKKCTGVIVVPATCNDFMVKCMTCGECTNIFKGLKVMQDTELMTRTAMRFYDACQYSKALNKFIDLLRIMFEVLAPPFQDFCQCQQHARDCFLHFGNFYNIN